MLVSIDELTDYMGGLKLTVKQRDITERVILPGVQSELETHLNRYVELTHIREWRPANYDGIVVFTQTPVWRVFSITGQRGTDYTPPSPPAWTPPDFVEMTGIRNMDTTNSGLQNTPLPYEYAVGGSAYNPYSSLLGGLTGTAQEPVYLCDYLAGWNGAGIPGMKLAMMRVAAREVERQFDDTMSIKGGSQDAAEDSDKRDKYWTQDELLEYDRYRRRVIV